MYSNLFKKCWIKRDETLQNNPKNGKTKKNRELGVLTSGIKRDGHKKKSGN